MAGKHHPIALLKTARRRRSSKNQRTLMPCIVQDGHVAYLEIEASLSISSTSIHSILHEDLAIQKRFVRVGSSKIWQSLKKGLVWVGPKNFWKFLSFINSFQVMNHGSMLLSPKQNSEWTARVLKDEPNPTVLLKQRRTDNLCGTPQFDSLKSSEKFETWTKEDGSLCSMKSKPKCDLNKY